MTDDRRRSRPAEAEIAPIELDGVGSDADAMTDRILGAPGGGPGGGGARASNSPGPIERASARPLAAPALPSPPPQARISEPVPSSRRMRAQVLRIPDDEIARPNAGSKIPPPDAATLPNLPHVPPDPRSAANVSDGGPPRLASVPPAGALVPSRIISIGTAHPMPSEPPRAVPHVPQIPHIPPPPPEGRGPATHFGVDSLNNDQWQPRVEEAPDSEPPTRRHLSTSTLQEFVDDSEPDAVSSAPVSEDIPVDIGDDSEEPTQVIEPVSSADADRVLANLPPSASMRAAVPLKESGRSIPVAPRAPMWASPEAIGGSVPPPRAPMRSSPDGLLSSGTSAVRPPAPSSPEFTGSTPPPHPSIPSPPQSQPPPRRTSTSPPVASRPPSDSVSGDAPEISSEDLVSIESLPAPAYVSNLPPMRAPARSNPPPIEPRPSSPSPPAPPAAGSAPSLLAAQAAPAASTAQSATSVPSLQAAKPQGAAGSAIAPPAVDASSAAAAGKKARRPWWEELFGDDYLRTQGKLSAGQIKAEADFIEESLGVQRGAMVLDLGCGTGLQAIELTRRGYQVVGFDLSLAMLAKAADEAQDRAQKINFVQGDMREMTFENTFDGVYSWNTSFGYFDEEKNAQVIGNVQRALRKGGQFLLDVVNRDYLMRQAPSLAWFEGEGCICMDEMNVDSITSRMKVKRTMMIDDGRSKEIEYSVRLYTLHELGKLLNEHGFRVAEVSGRIATPGVYFGAESPRTLILAEKR